jgi:hypothetical protein
VDSTDYTVPMQVLLDSYFQPIRRVPVADVDWDALESDSSFTDGDVFCFVYSRGTHQEFTHVGKILPKQGKNWLVSKLGRGPVVRTTLQSMADFFEGEFEEIQVYRRLPETW